MGFMIGGGMEIVKDLWIGCVWMCIISEFDHDINSIERSKIMTYYIPSISSYCYDGYPHFQPQFLHTSGIIVSQPTEY